MIGVEEGECDEDLDSFYPCEMEKGQTYLYRAINMWNLVDPQKAEELRRVIKDEVEKRNAQRRTIVDPNLARRIVEKLSGLEQALLRITDQNYRLRPDTVEQVMAQYPFLVDSWEEDGRTIYTLANNLQDVRNVRTFLERATSLGRDLEFD
jgi:hypothetical protein